MKKLEWNPRRKLYSFPAQEQESAKPVATPFSSDIFLTIPVKTNCRPVLTAETAPAATSPLTLSVFAEQKSESPENGKPLSPSAGQTSGPSDLQFCDGTSAQTVSPAATVTTVPENSGFLISPEDIFTDTTVSCTVSAPRDVVLPYEVPQVKYMYGCTATAMGMLLGYYDRYGYLGYNVSNLIKGDVELNARDYSGSIYDMDAFDTVLGSAIASKGHVKRFFGQEAPHEYPYTFVNGTTNLNISVFDCIADFLGTSQYWRDNNDYSTTYFPNTTLQYIINSTQKRTVSSGSISITTPIRCQDMKYGLMLYVQKAGYALDKYNTKDTYVDTIGGKFTFEDYMAEIDAGRVVLVHIEGHTMTGYGYNASTREIIFDDTYQHDQRMKWGGTYYYSGSRRRLKAISTILFDTSNLKPLVSGPVKNDINGNGISDIVFQNIGGDYQIGFWMDGTNTWRGQGIPESTAWEVLGAYDMNSSGKADIVMFGDVVLNGVRSAYIGYRIDGDMNNWKSISCLNNPDNINWNVKVGNVTGKAGKNSIVWHAPKLGSLGVWIDGTDQWKSISTKFTGKWELCGTGDFNGDNTDEILLRYNDSYYMTNLNGMLTSLGSTGTAWTLSAIGDFSGDGKDDLVFSNRTTGSVMKFENGRDSGYSSLGQLNAKDWFICGAGDYNGDGKDDLLVRQYSTGMLGWYDGGNMSKWHELGRGVDMKWAVIA